MPVWRRRGASSVVEQVKVRAQDVGMKGIVPHVMVKIQKIR